MVVDLIDAGQCYFLSRPRRFGKRPLVDTLKELFEGNRALFTGLAAQRHSVTRIDLGEGEVHSRAELERPLNEIIDDHVHHLGLTWHPPSPSGRFGEPIHLDG
ncbi:Predicted AAA-ATPase [Sphaerotilus natans]|nr:Predicted AAA-ATPase [Sphaerotilus natans]